MSIPKTFIKFASAIFFSCAIYTPSIHAGIRTDALSCAIIEFQCGAGTTEKNATLFQHYYSKELAGKGKLIVIPDRRVSETLDRTEFKINNYKTLPSAALIAGKILGVDTVVCGNIEKKDREFRFTASLIDVRSSSVMGSVKSSYTGDFEDFLRLAPSSNIKTLLALIHKDTPVNTTSTNKKKTRANYGMASAKTSSTHNNARQWQYVAQDNLRQFNEFISGRLEIGTRLTVYRLIEDKKDSFLGSVDFLNAQQNYMPVKIFADWLISPEWGIELTWDQLNAETITSYDGHNDGNVVASGPIVTVFGRRSITVGSAEQKTTLVPSIGLGLAFLKTDFNHEDWWHHGFDGETWQEAQSKYEQWRASGSPKWPNDGYRRNMSLDNTFAPVLTAGISAEFHKNFSADFYFRYMHLEIKDTYTRSRYGETFRENTVELPLSNYTFGFGLRYAF